MIFLFSLFISFNAQALEFELATDLSNPLFYNLGLTQTQSNDLRFGVHIKERFAIGIQADKIDADTNDGTSEADNDDEKPRLEKILTSFKGFYGTFYFEGHGEDSNYVTIRGGKALRNFEVMRGESRDSYESDGNYWGASYGYQWGLGGGVNLWLDLSYIKIDVDQTVSKDEDTYEYEFYESRAYFDFKVLFNANF
jgi:hypothetical protein